MIPLHYSRAAMNSADWVAKGKPADVLVDDRVPVGTVRPAHPNGEMLDGMIAHGLQHVARALASNRAGEALDKARVITFSVEIETGEGEPLTIKQAFDLSGLNR